MVTLDSLIEAATAKATEVVTITRGDGSTIQGARNYGSADNGVVQVYVVPVTARTVSKREHFRATFYLKQGDAWKRSSRAAAEAALRKPCLCGNPLDLTGTRVCNICGGSLEN